MAQACKQTHTAPLREAGLVLYDVCLLQAPAVKAPAPSTVRSGSTSFMQFVPPGPGVSTGGASSSYGIATQVAPEEQQQLQRPSMPGGRTMWPSQVNDV
jgi:hypothetical protein